MTFRSVPQRLRSAARDDEGTIGVLTLGFSVLAIMLILVGASATAVHLTHIRLGHLSDELAADAADAMGVGSYYDATNPDSAPLLADQAMRDAIQTHLASRDLEQLEGVTVLDVEALDAQTASVTVAITVYPLFGLEALMPFADGIELRATSVARAF